MKNSLCVGARNIGVNPKVNNLIRGYESSKHDILWILDSNIQVAVDCLSRSVHELCKTGVGLIHHLPCGLRPNTTGSQLEMTFLNTAHAKMYIAINSLGISSCVVGKSNLFRKSQLNRKGGLISFGKFMSEDNIIGQALWDQNLSHRITCDLAYQSLGSLSISEYIKRRARWTRIRKYAVPAATILEAFSESISCGICGSIAFYYFFGLSPYIFFGIHMALWFISDYAVYSTLYPKSSLLAPFPTFLVSWTFRELTAIYIYMYAVAGSTVEWRGKTYKLNRDGTVFVSKAKSTSTLDELVNKLM